MDSEDGSSARIKVAQYFVTKQLDKLKDESLLTVDVGPRFDDLQDLRRFLLPAPADLSQHAQSPPGSSPSIPTQDELVSWGDLLSLFPPSLPRDTPPAESDGPVELNLFRLGYRLPPWYRVAIIGAGVAGLRTAMFLQSLGIPYEILEASDRPGGRIFTYQFTAKPPVNPKGKHDYYDVGAMRFPDNRANHATFELFEELDLPTIPYIMSSPNNVRLYNKTRVTAEEATTAGDHFKDSEFVPQEYLHKSYTDPWGKPHLGVSACVAAAYDPFRKSLIDNFPDGWEELLKFDWASTRSYLTGEREGPKYPLPVVHWMETRQSGTGGFDRALSEAILDSLEFRDPTQDVKWRCLEGGSEVLIDAMLAKLETKPSYGQRVTSVERVYSSPPGHTFQSFMKVGVSGKTDQHFTHVVSTVPFSALNIINTEQVPMTYKQRQAIRTLNYGPSIKIAIKFRSRWWEDQGQRGGSSYTDRPSRVVVYPSYGLGEDGPGVLMVAYNWHQDANRFGALIKNPDWSDKLDPDRDRPESENVLLGQVYEDLAALHGKDVKWLMGETLDYHAFDWYHSPYTLGAFAHFAPGQFSTFFADITQTAGDGRFHFAGEVASHHHAWVSGALDSALRAVEEILCLDFYRHAHHFREKYGESLAFRDAETTNQQFLKGFLSKELEEAEFSSNKGKQ